MIVRQSIAAFLYKGAREYFGANASDMLVQSIAKLKQDNMKFARVLFRDSFFTEITDFIFHSTMHGVCNCGEVCSLTSAYKHRIMCRLQYIP